MTPAAGTPPKANAAVGTRTQNAYSAASKPAALKRNVVSSRRNIATGQ